MRRPTELLFVAAVCGVGAPRTARPSSAFTRSTRCARVKALRSQNERHDRDPAHHTPTGSKQVVPGMRGKAVQSGGKRKTFSIGRDLAGDRQNASRAPIEKGLPAPATDGGAYFHPSGREETCFYLSCTA